MRCVWEMLTLFVGRCVVHPTTLHRRSFSAEVTATRLTSGPSVASCALCFVIVLLVCSTVTVVSNVYFNLLNIIELTDYNSYKLLLWWRLGVVVSIVGRTNEVNQHRAWLVLWWVTAIRVNHLSNQPPRSTQPCIPLGSLSRVPASPGVKAGMSPLPGGR